MAKDYPTYSLYKGLQKPLEFMGLQGRYIMWAAICGLSCFILFATMFALFGIWIAIFSLILGLGSSIGVISLKQRSGLHDKNKMRGIYIVSQVFQIK